MSHSGLVLFLVLVALFSTGQCQYSRNYNSTTTTNTRRVYTSTAPVLVQSRFRFECRNVFPTRSDIVPNGVIFTGFVDDIKQDNNDDDGYMASVTVRRVFLGPRNLRKTRVTVTGFGGTRGGGGNSEASGKWCHSNVKRGDTWIFVLQPITYPDYFRLNSSLIKITLNNLEKIEGIAADTYPKLTTVTDLPCEKKYCENNGICVEDKYSGDGTKCECLSFCKPNYSPVCGSNDETYNNECELRLKSCYISKNLFVKSLSSCQFSPAISSTSSTSYRYSSTGSSSPSSPTSHSVSHSSPSYSSGLPSSPNTSTYTYSSSYRGSGVPLNPKPELPLPPTSIYTSRSREPERTSTRTRTQTTTINRYQY